MQTMKNDIAKFVKQGWKEDDIKEAIRAKYGDDIKQSSIEKAFKELAGAKYDLVQKVMRSELISDMNSKGKTIYMDDPFCSDIKTIEYPQLSYILDKKLVNSLDIKPCEFDYDPFKSSRIFRKNKTDLVSYFNTYVPPSWMVDEHGQYKEVEKNEKMPDIYIVFFKHLVDGKESEFNYIIMWLANAIQYRNFCVLTAIGAPGIGKGVLGSIMIWLVGRHNFHKTDNKLITKDFNKQFQNKRLVFCDEMNIRKTDHMNKFKDLINDIIEIEAKGENAKLTKNFASIYIASNNLDSLTIPENDRRFSVIELTKKPLVDILTSDNIEELTKEENVNELAKYLYHYKVDREKMLRVHTSKRTEEIKYSSLTDAEEWFIEDYAKDKQGQEILLSICQDAFREKEYKAPSRRDFEKLQERFSRVFSVRYVPSLNGKRVRKIKFAEVQNG